MFANWWACHFVAVASPQRPGGPARAAGWVVVPLALSACNHLGLHASLIMRPFLPAWMDTSVRASSLSTRSPARPQILPLPSPLPAGHLPQRRRAVHATWRGRGPAGSIQGGTPGLARLARLLRRAQRGADPPSSGSGSSNGSRAANRRSRLKNSLSTAWLPVPD